MAEYIEREAVHNLVRRATKYAWTSPVRAEYRSTVSVDDIHFGVDKIPAEDVAPVVHGRWEEKFFTNDRQRVCSVCHCTVRQPSYDKGETALFKYCPHCGARMDGE